MTSLSPSAAPLLELSGVEVRYPVGRDWLGRSKGQAHALNGIDLCLFPGETLGVLGESGCGKSTLAQVLMGLVEPVSGTLAATGSTNGQRNIQIVFQDPQSSLDPRLPVWKLITEPLVVRGRKGTAELRAVAECLALQVGIRPEYLDRHPHQFSGGQRQRIAIARALSSDPDVIILDEPTSALDISVQAQILNLLAKLQRERGLTFVLISHNVSVVRHLANRVAVMYLGQIVELGAAEQVLERPNHPYTRLLLEAVPRLDQPLTGDAAAQRTELPGNRVLPSGCFFRDRCPQAGGGCERPQQLLPATLVEVRCHRVTGLMALARGTTALA
ncbi:oligopeptide/dipeptide ABC transporter ATP-binding protein [Pseudomonas oryzihabitans]|uniref:oligopeptide/dipeptide ABC transporter ATP-binding protein n=1 Tax=Pseudomonas oryzihabitans TaxID=47885 RepID=UPI002861E235|nr:oligopeptide/dipeptide ABC transporter ATP-binding protein [Pseudomonas psychrotolerans]MDR6677526.1 peptide/nickel transport system ATP-binding protein [Pseudomonas psychrotolerans]